MDWENMKQQWRQADEAMPAVSLEQLRRQEEAICKQLRRRDRLETAAAIFVAVCFGVAALVLLAGAKWLAAGFALLLVVWAALVPLRLRHARRQMPGQTPQLPLLESLGRQRDAALAQARMLEQVWLWYLTPPTIGIAGLTLVLSGPSTFALVYLGSLLVLYVVIAWFNRRTARTKFRVLADHLQCQIDELAAEDAS